MKNARNRKSIAPGQGRWPSFLDAKSWFVFLLRSDIFGDVVSNDRSIQLRFLMWWLWYGRKEYNGSQPTAEQKFLAWEEVETPLAAGGAISRLLAYVLEGRDDVVNAFRTREANGAARANAWLFGYGLREMSLEYLVDARLRHWLGEPAPSDPAGLTRLEAMFWACDSEKINRFDIPRFKDAGAFKSWFEDAGFVALGLEPFLRDTPGGLSASGAPGELGFNLIGYAYGELGVGEDVRAMASALTAAEVPFCVEDFSDDLKHRQLDRRIENHVFEAKGNFIDCFCLTAFDTARYFCHGAADGSRYAIGYWPWELPLWPSAWIAAFDLVDEIWVSSRFIQDCISIDATIPVIYMPMAVEIDNIAPFDRRKLKAEAEDCIFLFVFDGYSYLQRKNPQAVLAAFRQAFTGKDQGVKLVFKTMNEPIGDKDWDAFKAEINEDPRVILIGETWDRPSVLGLIAACDVYVSLHRAEGFGRTIAEAMLLGKPVIATAWSGSDELINEKTALPVTARLVAVPEGAYPWSKNAIWAEPAIGEAAEYLRRMAEDRDLRQRLGQSGKAFVENRHAPAVVGARYRRRLQVLRDADDCGSLM